MSHSQNRNRELLNRVIKFLTSLRLTVVCLACAVALVFMGTLAQADEGLYHAQHRWFRSFLIWWGPRGASWAVPVFPGGYLIGGVLVVNLVVSHFNRFKLTWNKLGIHLAHAGIILLLLGQLATDLLSRESQIHFNEQETKAYSESSRDNELVFSTDSATPGVADVVSIPESVLKAQPALRDPRLPFTVNVREYHPNADIRRGNGNSTVLASEIVPQPESADTDRRNMPAAVLELAGAQGSPGTVVVSTFLSEQSYTSGGKTWRVALRNQREYLPYSLTLLKTTHDVYPGTDIPKNFQSRVRIENPAHGENREVDIFMNNPLRYQGLTFYQYQMGREEAGDSRGSSVLMVVRNPGWLTPYAGCLLVGAGMAIQFLMHLTGFVSKRRPA
jgi:hypothetical protein